MYAGFSQKSICPEKQVYLAGFDLRNEPCAGVLDAINVSALALKADESFLFLSFDLLGVPRDFCERAKAYLGQALALKSENIWLSATHTHAAPRSVFGGRDGDEEYIEHILQSARSAAEEAFGSLRPVKARIGRGRVKDVASIRDVPRELSEAGMPVLRLRLEGEGFEAELIRFTCHCTVLSEKNLLISRDLAGAFGDALPKGNHLFLNGACGDLSTRYTRKGEGEGELKRLGETAALGAQAIALSEEPGFGRRIRAAECEIALKRSASLSAEEKQRLIRFHERKLSETTDAAAKRESESIIAVLRRPERPPESTRRVKLSAADFSACMFLGLPFELNSPDGERMERELSLLAGKPVCVVCYTGGYESYLPSGKPIGEDSSYQDIASGYAPEDTLLVLESAKKLIDQLL